MTKQALGRMALRTLLVVVSLGVGVVFFGGSSGFLVER